MLALTGTNGNLGSRVLSSLLQHQLIPPEELVVSSSNPSKVPPEVVRAGVQVRYGDFLEPEALVSAFKGCDTLFLVSAPTPAEDRWKQHKEAVDAAKRAGIKTIIYTSLMFGGETGLKSVAGVQQAHIETVKLLALSGLDYVIIREGIYAESWWLYSGFQPRQFTKDVQELEFVIPDDGPVAWVGWDDLGEATAKILASYKQYIGQTLRLTGSKTLTITQIAQVIENTTGIKVKVSIVGAEEAAKVHKQKKSAPDWIVESWSKWHEGVRNGETAVIDPLLERILGRKPKGIEDLATSLFSLQ